MVKKLKIVKGVPIPGSPRNKKVRSVSKYEKLAVMEIGDMIPTSSSPGAIYQGVKKFRERHPDNDFKFKIKKISQRSNGIWRTA